MSSVRILFHSVHPGVKSGYGSQTALWVPRIAGAGHEVAISAFTGANGYVSEWEGFRVYPAGAHPQGADSVSVNAAHWNADLVITLMDVWALGPDALKGLPAAQWAPLDAGPSPALPWLPPSMSAGCRMCLEATGATPIAMSRFGEKLLPPAGFDPLFWPHGIDTTVFAPHPDRKGLRQALGIDDRFVIGIFAANMDNSRKGWQEQLTAFAKLHHRHPDTVLVLHTMAKNPTGVDLEYMRDDLGLSKSAVQFSSQYLQTIGSITPVDVAATMAACDLVSACAWGEGFGLPIAEAQACGTPVVATDGSAMAEVCGGWLVKGEPFYVVGNRCWWIRPNVDGILRVYERAYEKGAAYQAKRAAAREHALQYDVDHVAAQFMKPALEALEARWLC